MQQPHHAADPRQPYEVKRETRIDQKWSAPQAMEGFPKQMIYARPHPAHKMMQQQGLTQQQQQQLLQQQAQVQQKFMQPPPPQQQQHQGLVNPAVSAGHGAVYKVPLFNFTTQDLGVYLYGKQDLRMVRIEPRNAENSKQQKEKSKPAKWCDMCQEIRFGECHKHGTLAASPAYSGVPLDAPMSYAISTFPDEVGLCISGLPFAGYGVFARQFIPTGTWIGPYEGTRIPFEEGVKKMGKDTPFLWEICANGRVSHFLDASDENSSSWMRFIQCARHKGEQNLFVFQYCATIYYRAFKDVPPGVELLVWYDERYPHMFGLPLEINDMGTHSVESIQTSSELRQPQSETIMSGPTLMPPSGGRPGEPSQAHAGGPGSELMHRDLGKSSMSATSSSFAFPRPGGMPHPVAPGHMTSSAASFHPGSVPGHVRQRQEVPHPSMARFGVPVSMAMHQVPVMNAHPLGTTMKAVDDARIPNAPLPVQLIDKARVSLEENPTAAVHYGMVDFKGEVQMTPGESSAGGMQPSRLMLARPVVVSSTSLASDGSTNERKTPDKSQARQHAEFAAAGYGPNSWPWTCNNCGKSFNQKSMLHSHTCVQPSPAGPYLCDRCPMAFNDMNDARDHMETHRGERSPFKCPFCPRTFAGSTTLSNHIRTHDTERQFECQRCRKYFAQASHLAHHQKTPGECIG